MKAAQIVFVVFYIYTKLVSAQQCQAHSDCAEGWACLGAEEEVVAKGVIVKRGTCVNGQ